MKIIYNKRKHNPCHCDICMYSWYHQDCPGCPEGHNSFWQTVIESKEWKEWRIYQDKRGWEWDFSENEGLGLISSAHWTAFIKFTRDRNVKKLKHNKK